MIRALVSLYRPKYLSTLVYMLQGTEYQPGEYMRWFWRTNNFSQVMKRRKLDRTHAATLLLASLRIGATLQIVTGILLAVIGGSAGWVGAIPFGLALIIAYPIVWAHLVVVPLYLGKWFVVVPRDRQKIIASEKIFATHPGVRIAVAGSYGKTSMKELLSTVFSGVKKVAATPANKNVAISHAQFAHRLDGDEDIVILEYGEGAPGDVARFAQTTHPTHAVITGIAPAHLDKYKTLQAAAGDIFSVADVVEPRRVYVNAESRATKAFMKQEFNQYDETGALGYKVQDIQIGIDGTEFTLKKGKQSLHIRSGLLGRHQIGPLSLAAALGLEFGLSKDQVAAAIAKTAPFEHRMQPYALNGAWVIDDTYNGNIEGIRAGTRLLADLSAQRKWYVTPGLVDQGEESVATHKEMGQLIAGAEPDIVVLMKNSATKHIQAGLTEANYSGEVRIEENPLDFYLNLNQFLATGDLALMQNDWTDNYA